MLLNDQGGIRRLGRGARERYGKACQTFRAHLVMHDLCVPVSFETVKRNSELSCHQHSAACQLHPLFCLPFASWLVQSASAIPLTSSWLP